jgi:hypothetical protein
MAMDIDFKEKLARRKQELLSARMPEQKPDVSTYEERFLARVHSFTESVTSTSLRMLVGAAIFSILLSLAVFRDWWGFLGSPEYSQYKQRVEREVSPR